MITHNTIGYSGRLGNQMFQYAALKSLATENGCECWLPKHTDVKEDGCYDLTNNKWIPYKLDLLDCFEITTPFGPNLNSRIYPEPSFEFDPNFFELGCMITITGYFQSYKYFEKHNDVILKEFTFKKDILEKCKNEISKYKNTVSIHVRRGDYINHPNFWTVTPEYLSEAISHFDDKEYTFLVFSDDIEWCKQIFPDEVIFIEGNNQFEDLCLMSLCEHNIIANSSYSWWGAWLNQNPNKKVIAPSQWFSEPKNLNDLYPKEWIII